MSSTYLYLLLLLPPLSSPQSFHWGSCHSPQVQEDFRLDQVRRQKHTCAPPQVNVFLSVYSTWAGGTWSRRCPPSSRRESASAPTTAWARRAACRCWRPSRSEWREEPIWLFYRSGWHHHQTRFRNHPDKTDQIPARKTEWIHQVSKWIQNEFVCSFCGDPPEIAQWVSSLC